MLVLVTDGFFSCPESEGKPRLKTEVGDFSRCCCVSELLLAIFVITRQPDLLVLHPDDLQGFLEEQYVTLVQIRKWVKGCDEMHLLSNRFFAQVIVVVPTEVYELELKEEDMPARFQ
jgi:hypothetical protein